MTPFAPADMAFFTFETEWAQEKVLINVGHVMRTDKAN